MTFRKKDVTTDDILAALEDVRSQVRPATDSKEYPPTA